MTCPTCNTEYADSDLAEGYCSMCALSPDVRMRIAIKNWRKVPEDYKSTLRIEWRTDDAKFGPVDRAEAERALKAAVALLRALGDA